MKKNHCLTTSEFSRISEVSRQSLIFYDKIGLFSPKFIGENGYRYYSHEQIYMIFVINILKELGTPLKTIKAYMQNITPTDAIDLLEQQDRVLTKKIAELNGFQDMLHVKVQSILQGINSGEFEPKVIRQAAMPLFLSDPIDKKKADLSDEEWLGLYGKCKTHGIALGYPEGFMVSKSALLSGTTDQVSRIICHVGDFSYGNSAMPGGTYLVACGNGSFEDTEPIYKRMFQYIEENSFQIIGNAYEARLIDETGSKDREKQIIQVKIRISTKK